MEFQQLEMFVAVVETGSVREAADRVFRTAPAVSIALKKLEEEIGALLFDRSQRHPPKLTEAGTLLYSYAARILELRRDATDSLKDLRQDKEANLRIGTYESTSLYLLPPLIHALQQTRPGLRTEVLCGNSERLLTALRNRAIDVAVVVDPPDDSNLKRYLIARDRLVLAASPAHRLSTLTEVHVRDLAGEFLIVQGAKSLLRERVVQAFTEAETPFKVTVENIPVEAIKRMAVQGLGIGFLPSMCIRAEAERNELAIVDVQGFRGDWDLWLVHLKERRLSAAARAFVQTSIQSAPAVTDLKSEENGSGDITTARPFPFKRSYC